MLIIIIIIISLLETIVVIILLSMIMYLKHSKTTGKVRHFLIVHNSKNNASLPSTNKLQTQREPTVDISSPKLVSTTAVTKNQNHFK